MVDPVSYGLNPQPERGGNKKTIVIILIVLAVLAAIGGFLFLSKSQKSEDVKRAVEKDKTPSVTPTPTKKPINKENVKIQVINGTGTPGQAATALEALTQAGYKKENIKTGNADEFDQIKTAIARKKGFEDVAEDIKKALGSKFDNIEIESVGLDIDGEFDIVITTGGKIFEEATSPPKPSPTVSRVSPTPTSTSGIPTVSPTLTLTPTPTP